MRITVVVAACVVLASCAVVGRTRADDGVLTDGLSAAVRGVGNFVKVHER